MRIPAADHYLQTLRLVKNEFKEEYDLANAMVEGKTLPGMDNVERIGELRIKILDCLSECIDSILKDEQFRFPIMGRREVLVLEGGLRSAIDVLSRSLDVNLSIADLTEVAGVDNTDISSVKACEKMYINTQIYCGLQMMDTMDRIVHDINVYKHFNRR